VLQTKSSATQMCRLCRAQAVENCGIKDEIP